MRPRATVVPLLLIGGAIAAAVMFSRAGEAPPPPPASTDGEQEPDATTATQTGTATEERDEADSAPTRTEVAGGPAVRGRLMQGGQPMGQRVVRCIERWGRRDAEVVFTTTCDADGRFAVHSAKRQYVTLEFSGPGVPVPWIQRRVEIGGGSDVDLGDLEVPAPGALRGRVVDEHGTPMPRIVVLHSHRPGHSTPDFDRGADLSSVRIPHVTTDRSGDFSFSNLPPGEHFVLVEPPEHVDLQESVELTSGLSHDLGTLRLTPGRVVRGRVFDERGAALPGARVAAGTGRFSVVAHRKGNVTGPDGSFELRGLGRRPRVTVKADGFAPHSELVSTDAQPLIVELERALTLSGTVSGHGGRSTTIKLDSDPSGPGSTPPSWAYSQLHRRHEVDADGSFRIENLGPGDYSIRASTPGVGLSNAVAFSLPRNDPIELEIVRDVAVEVHVVDDVGAAVPGARVVRDPGIEEYPRLYRPESKGLAKRILKAWRARKRVSETDERGIARLPIEPDAPLAIAADHDRHLPGAVVLPGGTTEPVRIVLQRAGRVAGLLSDVSNQTRFLLRVRVWPANVSAAAAHEKNHGVTANVDAQGRFRSEPLAPGRYRVAIDRFNMTWQDDPSRRLTDVTPLLGDGVDARSQAEVDVLPGADAQVEIETTPLGRLRGTVLVGAAPAPGVVVWAADAGQERPNGMGIRSWDVDDAHQFEPYTKTDEQGRFEFALASTGTWHLYARHPDAAYPTGPFVVRVTTPDADLVHDIRLHGAEVVGRYDASGIADKDKKWFVAYLFRLEQASDDAFYSPHHGLPKSWGMREEPVGTTGAFAFHMLPAGTWVLRLVGRRDRVAYWQIVETAPGQRVDLGEVTAPAVVDATVRCGDKDVDGVWLRQPASGSPKGLFVSTAGVREGSIQFEGIPPGRYTAEPFGGQRGWRIGLSGKSLGDPVELIVHPDGTTEPEAIFE